MEADGREGSRKLFEAFNQQIEAQGYIAREGSIIDASFTESPRQRNSREQNQSTKAGERPEEFDTNPAVGRQKDSEVRWTKKNNESHYGWKNHVKADLKKPSSSSKPPPHRRMCMTARSLKTCLMTKTRPCSPIAPTTAPNTKSISSRSTPRSSSCAKPREAMR